MFSNLKSPIFACDDLDESFVTLYDHRFVTPHIIVESRSFLFHPLANLSRNKGRTFPSVSKLSTHFFISPIHLQSTENLPLPLLLQQTHS